MQNEENHIKNENEQKKNYLRGYRKHIRRINRIESDLEEIRSMKCYPSVNSDGMPHASNNIDLSDYAATVDSKERALIEEKRLRVKAYEAISNQIELLQSDKEKDVLHYRYIKGLDWWEIAEKMKYTERHVTRIHGEALSHFEIPKENKDVLVCPKDTL